MRLLRKCIGMAIGAALAMGTLAIAEASASDTDSGSETCAVGKRPQLYTKGSALSGVVKLSHTWNGAGGGKSTGLKTQTTLTSSYYPGYRSASWSAYVSTSFLEVTPGCINDPV